MASSRELRLVSWRRLDVPGMDAARLVRVDGGWRIAGTAIVVHEGEPCVFSYEVACDDGWRTRGARVTGWMGGSEVDRTLRPDEDGRWRLDGVHQPQVDGCIDVDLAFTPATNTLPIRRLDLAVGASAPVSAAWLRFPWLDVARLEQVYRREGEHLYRYESNGGRFTAPIEVDDAGLVRRYDELWRAE